MTAQPATLRPGEIVRIRDERWLVVRHLSYANGTIVEVSGSDRTNRAVRARFVLPVETVDVLPSSRVPRVVRPVLWRHVARRALAEALSPGDVLRTIAAANVLVMPFQLEPALAVLRGLGSRVLIADEVGLGKTVQAALIVAELLDRLHDPHVLIVSPAGLRDQWRGELEHRFGIYAGYIDSATLARSGVRAAPGSNPWRSNPVVIASIDYVKRPEVLRALETAIWDAVVFDEAHALAGRSDRAAAAAALADRARILIMLSATPHSGDDVSFARLCDLGNLAHAFPLLAFRRTRRDVGITTSRRTMWLRVRPTSEETEMHAALIEYARRVWTRPGAFASGAQLAMTVLVKRACSSPASLARSIAHRLTMLGTAGISTARQPSLPLGDAGGDEEPTTLLIAAGLDDVEEERRCLLRVLEIARAASTRESKLRALSRLLRRAQEPTIVFTEYRDTLTQVTAILEERAVATLHGGLTATERADSLDRFTRGDARLLVATDAASEGLNLQQRCRLVVNLELPWSPLRLEQRIGRVDRLGQHRRVHAVHFIAAGTGEESTVARLFLRMERMQCSTAHLGRPPLDEHAVARSVIAEEAPFKDQGSEVGDRLPRQVLVPDLRSPAREEAERTATARRLGSGATNTTPIDRPVVTCIRRRTQSPRGYWAFRLAYDDAAGVRRWELLLGVEQSVAHLTPRAPADVRAMVERHATAARSAARAAQHDRLTGLSGRFHAFVELATAREHAILDAARQHHARIAARLLQPGLFDHRTERAGAAQVAVLNEVLAHGAARLRELELGERIAVGACDLVFAVIVD